MTRIARRTDTASGFLYRFQLLADRRAALFLLIPTAVALLIVDGYPLISAIMMSLQKRSLDSPNVSFVGFDNYLRLFADPQTLKSIGLSLVFTIGSVGLSFIVGMAGALLLNPPIPGRGILRALFIIPWAVPAFVAALSWSWIFNDQFGILSAALRSIGITNPPVWLDTDHAMGSLILVMFWKSFPFQLVMLLAGLQSIPSELYEAAELDGAGPIARFWRITLPLLLPVSMASLMLAVINAFQFFPIPWILTGGGPSGATNVIPISAYNLVFQAGEISSGSTLAVIMFLVTLVAAIAFVSVYSKKVGEL